MNTAVMFCIAAALVSLLVVKAEVLEKDQESQHQNLCTSMLISDSIIYPGETSYVVHNMWGVTYHICASEGQGSILRFRNVANLLRVEDGMRLMIILKSISCLMTIAHVSSDTEASQLIDFVTKFRIAQKYLTIVNPKLDVKSLQNTTINFNVLLHHLGPGANGLKINLSRYIVSIKYMSFADGKVANTSLCPTLGKNHAVPYIGPCPKHLGNPYGKELKISFIGGKPYISYNPVGGSDFLVVKILAKKFRFSPKFIPERSYDIVINNKTTYGMLYQVRTKDKNPSLQSSTIVFR